MSGRVFQTTLGSFGDNAANPRPAGGKRICGLFSLASLVAILVASGCNTETRVPVFPVSGKLTYQGQAPVGAQVVLHPVNTSGTNEVAPTGIVLDDGSFKITAYDPEDGAPQGDYVATVQWFKITKDVGGPGPNVIPKKYTNPKTSPIKITVSGGPTEVPPITIANN
jgi:hypothetical protein